MYDIMTLENDLTNIEWQCQQAEQAVALLESHLASMDEKATAARELLAEAEKILAGPTIWGTTAEARYDKQKADAVLAKIGDSRPNIADQLEGVKNRLAMWTQRKQDFPMDELRKQRKLQQLRNRVR